MATELQDDDRATISAQQQYLTRVEKRVRRADLAVVSRVAGLQTAWGVALLAGAGVSLVQAIEGATALTTNGARFITALLGFVVVVAQGATQLLARTSRVVKADDEMRRNLARERRLFECGGAPYADAVDPFSLFVERAEAELARHDDHVATYSAALLRNDN